MDPNLIDHDLAEEWKHRRSPDTRDMHYRREGSGLYYALASAAYWHSRALTAERRLLRKKLFLLAQILVPPVGVALGIWLYQIL